MRTYPIFAMLALTACSPAEKQPQAAADATPIACALHGARNFAGDCLVEKIAGEVGTEFTVRYPDGGFRRLRIANDRSGMVAIDGADEASNSLIGQPPVLEVTVDEDRYRFPADLDAPKAR